MCRLYVKFVRKARGLCKTRLIFPRINGPNVGDVRKRAGSGRSPPLLHVPRHM